MLFMLVSSVSFAQAQIKEGFKFSENIKTLPIDMLTRHRILYATSEMLNKEGVFYSQDAPVLIDVYVKTAVEADKKTECAKELSDLERGDLIICLHRTASESSSVTNIDAAMGKLKMNKDGSVDFSEKSIKRAVKHAVEQIVG